MGFTQNLRHLMKLNSMSKYRLAQLLNVSQTTTANWEKGKSIPYKKDLPRIAEVFGISVEALMGDELPNIPSANDEKSAGFNPPNIVKDYVSFPVLGEVAAGYDHVCYEDWTGSTMDIPASYLKGRQPEEFFVLRVVGQSMYPMYQHGDHVFVQRCETLSRSGEVGVVLYDDEKVTLKRVEYMQGQDWMKLVPINPQLPPEIIEGERLEHCRILGIPKLLIREIDD